MLKEKIMDISIIFYQTNLKETRRNQKEKKKSVNL